MKIDDARASIPVLAGTEAEIIESLRVKAAFLQEVESRFRGGTGAAGRLVNIWRTF